MNRPAFKNIISLSNDQILDEIIKTENTIFNLRFKKATKQAFKIHELRNEKRYLSQLQTLLTMRSK